MEKRVNTADYNKYAQMRDYMHRNITVRSVAEALGLKTSCTDNYINLPDRDGVLRVRPNRSSKISDPHFYYDYEYHTGGDAAQFILETPYLGIKNWRKAMDLIFRLLNINEDWSGGINIKNLKNPLKFPEPAKIKREKVNLEISKEIQEQVLELLGDFKDKINECYLIKRHEDPKDFIDEMPFRELADTGNLGEQIKRRYGINGKIYSNFLVIPWFSKNKKLIGLQGRLTRNCADSFRYSWIWSCSCGTVYPEEYKDKNTVFITEGMFKARAIASIGYRTLALASISSRQGILEELEDLDEDTKIIIALDNDVYEDDKIDNLWAIEEKLEEKFKNINVALFPLQYKGIDDYIYSCITNEREQSDVEYPLIGILNFKDFKTNIKNKDTPFDLDWARPEYAKGRSANFAVAMNDKQIFALMKTFKLYDRFLPFISDELIALREINHYIPDVQDQNKSLTYLRDVRSQSTYYLNICLGWLSESIVEYGLKSVGVTVKKTGCDENYVFKKDLKDVSTDPDLYIEEKDTYIEVVSKCTGDNVKIIRPNPLRGSKARRFKELTKEGHNTIITMVNFVGGEIINWKVKEDTEIGEEQFIYGLHKKGHDFKLSEKDIIGKTPLRKVIKGIIEYSNK